MKAVTRDITRPPPFLLWTSLNWTKRNHSPFWPNDSMLIKMVNIYGCYIALWDTQKDLSIIYTGPIHYGRRYFTMSFVCRATESIDWKPRQLHETGYKPSYIVGCMLPSTRFVPDDFTLLKLFGRKPCRAPTVHSNHVSSLSFCFLLHDVTQ